MRAEYVEPDQISVSLDEGETLATLTGPCTETITAQPGLWIYDALVASGCPIDPPPRVALGSALRAALKATDQAAAWQEVLGRQSQDTRDWWASRYDRPIPITATKLKRVAAACAPPIDLDALFAAAGA